MVYLGEGNGDVLCRCVTCHVRKADGQCVGRAGLACIGITQGVFTGCYILFRFSASCFCRTFRVGVQHRFALFDDTGSDTGGSVCQCEYHGCTTWRAERSSRSGRVEVERMGDGSRLAALAAFQCVGMCAVAGDSCHCFLCKGCSLWGRSG